MNHNGDLQEAYRLVDAAVSAGVDAIKFQSFIPEKLVTSYAAKAAYQQRNDPEGTTQLEMLKALELNQSQHQALQHYCVERGLLFLSTPFDEESADMLLEMGVPLFKIGSGDLTNAFLLAHVARLGRPIILSTGMSNMRAVEEAVRLLREAGCQDLALLHCVSHYPAPAEYANLRAMDALREQFCVPVGFSDHTCGYDIAVAAVARGAEVIEKHLTMDRAAAGPDHPASLEPDELKGMVAAIRSVEQALGDGVKKPAPGEDDMAIAAQRSMVAACDIAAGTICCRTLIEAKRPGNGLSPMAFSVLDGHTFLQSVARGEQISREMLE